MGKIRNIMQTVGEREVVKTAPDMVVYLEGLPYIKNAFLTTNPQQPYLVNFNDHVTGFNANYDMEQQIPNCTVSMSVPAHLRYLYQAPGGNNVIKTMMQIQVFVKGYYFAPDGNTLFQRVFKGYTSHVTHTDDGKTLQISIQCKGILGFFEMMQIDLSPALQSSSPQQVTALKTTLAHMNPYQQMAFAFLYPSLTDGFYVNAIGKLGSNITTSRYFDAVQDGFIAKWQTIIADICQEAHIYGLQTTDIQNVTSFLSQIAKKSQFAGNTGWSRFASAQKFDSPIKESEGPQKIINVPQIQRLQADMGLGSIQLINGKVVTRAALLRTNAHLINYELFQDINGEIIIKPPLYNLDVTNLGINPQSAPSSSLHHVSKSNNPFIINLAEITNEQETEDEGAVRATRMVIQGATSVAYQFIQLDPKIRATTEFIDIPKMSQFGLREEPARAIPWLLNSETLSQFASAAAELALANRGYRTYTCTIPMRPELKLGFPVYLPHKDMYGYLKSVSINFQIGGAATMSIMLDTLRKRPVYPQAQKDGTVIFVAQPNLVLKWTKGAATNSTAPGDQSTQSFIDSLSGVNWADPQASPAKSDGMYFTVTKPPTDPDPTPNQKAIIALQQQSLGSYFALAGDTKDASWRVQPDTDNTWSAKDPTTAGLFSRSVSVDKDFNFYEAIRTTIPYTDEKGYEVVTPFPWGRWFDINTAIQEFCVGGYVATKQPDSITYQVVQQSNAFIYAGLGTPVNTTDTAPALEKALLALQQSLGVNTNAGGAGTTQEPTTTNPASQTGPIGVDLTTFELSYSSFTPGGANSIIQLGSPETRVDSALLSNTIAAQQQKVNMFLTGHGPQPDLTLASQLKAVGNTTRSAGQTPLTPGQFVVQK